MKRNLLLIVLLFSLIWVVGCGGNRLEGTWARNDHEKFTFNSDGTVVVNLDGATINGTYTINEEEAIVNLMGDEEDVEFTDNPNEIEMGGYTYTKE